MSASPTPTPTPTLTLTPATTPATTPPLVHEVEGLRYALDRVPTRHARSVVTVRLVDHPDDPGFRDRVDLYSFKSRQAFAARVAEAFGRQTGAVLGALTLVLDALERALAQAPAADPSALSPERRAAADALLAAPDLLERVATAMDALGHAGEPALKRLCYLVATSRLLPRPLSALLQAPSGTGKSALLEATTALLPPEQVVPLVRLTAHSLYYMGPDALRHKLVAVDEYEGASEADHPLRVLQSKGELRLSVTQRGRAEEVVAHGPVAVLSGTTQSGLDPQNLSRCLELALDDSPAQTRRIHAAQARARAGRAPTLPPPELQALQDAQRLLRPLPVVVPFAEELTFPARTPADRRGPGKTYALIEAHALLAQRRRETDRAGRLVATREDLDAVEALLAAALPAREPELSPRAARALEVLRAQPTLSLDRRALARACGWSYNTAKAALAELAVAELATRVEVGPPARFALLPLG